MEKFKKFVKASADALMTIILVIGGVFIILYVIGIEPFVVESGSMEPSLHVGSLCFVNKHYSYDKVQVDDIVAFTVPTKSKVAHRVINITETSLETKGDANDKPDNYLVTKDNYIGKTLFSIPKIGILVKFAQTTRGMIILGTIIVVILLYGFLMDNDKKKSSKKEKKLRQEI